MIKNVNGNITFIAFSLTIMILSYATINLAISLTELKLLEHRSRAYLCAKHVIKKTQDVTRSLFITNIALKILNGVLLSHPIAKAFSSLGKKVIIYLQEIYHKLYLTQILFTNECRYHNSFHFLKMNPSIGGGQLKRSGLSKTVKLRSEWTSYLYFVSQKNHMKKEDSFIIKVNFKRDQMNLKITAKEMAMKDLWPLRHAYGLQ